MKKHHKPFDRRGFIKKTSCFAIGTGSLLNLPLTGWSKPVNDQDDFFVIGPREGFTPQVGTLVSMLNLTQEYKKGIKPLSIEDLDYLHDAQANSIGSLLLHMIAQERVAQERTFGGMKWDGEIPPLGDKARQRIKGNDSAYYLEKLNNVREYTLKEMAKRDDNWLMEIIKDHPWKVPINNYGEWFHVIEHDYQHVGQINFLKNRLASIKKDE